MRNVFAACPIATISNAVNQNANTSGLTVASLKSEPCQASGKIRGIREIYIFNRKLTSRQRRRRRRFAVPAINRAVRQLWRQNKKIHLRFLVTSSNKATACNSCKQVRERWGQRIVHLHLFNGFYTIWSKTSNTD